MQILVIVIVADFLFWHQRIGLSLMVFALAVVLIAGLNRPRAVQIKAGLICLAGALPVADHLQPLSVVFLILGLTAAVVTVQGRGAGLCDLAMRMAGFLLSLPGQWPRGLWPGGVRRIRVPVSALMPGAQRAALLRDWAFPLAGSMIFLGLLLDANPVFLALGAEYIDLWRLLQRALFWIGIGILVAPALWQAPPALTPSDLRQARLTLPPLRRPTMGLNTRSVLRALLMLNALISLQMISDLAILIGGADVPGGMTYAEYAHRGAYPLLATAMLAIAFAILARPFWHEHRLIRPLMLIWLVQNIILTGAAALRLELYIDAYGLTCLRICALIWMGLVALCLGLSVLQLALNRHTAWLVGRAALAGAVTLYLCAFLNFAAIIAAQNLARPEPDLAYICGLGPMAAAEINAALTADPDLLRDPGGFTRLCPARIAPRIDGWRDWGLRSWRVSLMVSAPKTRQGGIPEQAE